jgi:hypothetical protein
VLAWQTHQARLQILQLADSSTACGSTLRLLSQAEGASVNRFAKIGGLISVNGIEYGLTTAHQLLEDSATSPTDDEDTYDSSSGDECDEDLDGKPLVLAKRRTQKRGKSAQSSQPITQDLWPERSPLLEIRHARLGAWSYEGKGSLAGKLDYFNASPESPQNSDFALVELHMDPENPLDNHFYPPGRTKAVYVNTTSKGLASVPVFIVCGPHDVRDGVMLENSSTFMRKTAIFETRKIQLQNALGIPL